MALCLLPLVFLVVVTVVKKLLLPTSISLPISAVMLAFIRMAYLGTPSNFVMACMVSGLFEALTPLSIVTGAIMLFQTMHHTKVSGRHLSTGVQSWADTATLLPHTQQWLSPTVVLCCWTVGGAVCFPLGLGCTATFHFRVTHPLQGFACSV